MTEHGQFSGSAFMPAILCRLAPSLGAEVVFEPEYGIVGRIRFPNGRQSYFWHNKFNLNSVIAARLCQDKGYTSFWLKEGGFRVPDSAVFFQDAYCAPNGFRKCHAEAMKFARSLNWQVYLKPLRGSQGRGIMRTCDEAEYDEAARLIFGNERKVLIQAAHQGRDYRIVVLDGDVISAYERVPLMVRGDGASSINDLLRKKQKEFESAGRDTVISASDPRMIVKLRRENLTMESVVPPGATVTLLDVANLSCGGTTIEVTDSLHPTVATLAANICQALDLRFAGVDVLIPDATEALEDYAVIELNSAPGLDHYASSGPGHEARIDALYLKVLQAIERGPLNQSVPIKQ